MKKNWILKIFITISVPIIAGCSDNEDRDLPLDTQVQTMYESYRDEFPDIGEVSVNDLKAWLSDEEVVLIDVREENEQAVSIIEGAITKQEYESNAKAYSGKKIVAYCTIGYRSGLYVKELKERGIEAHNLQGSILAWVNAGMPLQDGNGKSTNQVHVYGKKWNLIPDEYEGVW